jgi:tetratricopeptide (TPR) repeat protein
VLGASGAGKSSLAQAGIVPALAVRGVVPGVGAWRRAVIRPGGHPGGPFMALAAGLAADDALPELLAGQDTSALARHLEAAAADPGFPVVSALTAPEQAARRRGELLSIESIRLILVVDQLEELFTLGEVTPDQRKAFILCLRGLMDSGRVFVVATMRSDYWHRAADVPLLVALSEGRGRLDLLPPSQAEIAEMIRRPAEVAGLWFENDPRTEIRLDAALAEDAAHEPGALPLLSFLLDALYARDVQSDNGSTLRYASMQALGGLKGAIATRAEAAFNALPADAQAALPKALRALVTVSRSGAEPTARAVPMSRFADGSPERRVVDAFLDPQVRLLVADGDGDGARVRLAHEALMTHWERARDQLVADRRDLEIRALIEQQQARWMRATGSVRRKLLLRDPDLAIGIDLVKRWGEDIETRLHDFILRSRRARRWRLATFILIPPLPFIVLTLMGLAVILFSMYDRANVRNKMLAALDMVDGLNVQIIERLLSAPSLSPEDVSAAFEAAQNANNSDGLYYENSDDPRFDETRYLFYRGFGLAFEKANDLSDALSCAAETLALDRKRTLEGRFGFGQFSRTWKADFLTAFEGKHNAPSPIDWFVELERHSGNLPAALKAAEDQLDVYKRAITQATGYWLSGMGQYDLQRQIWDIYRQIGDLRLEGNDSEGAAAAYGRMLANVQEALEQAPGKIAGQYLSLLYRDYSKSLLSIASMKARQNDLAGAIADYEKAASIDRDHLHDMFPAVTEIEISGELAALGNLRERAGTLSDKARNRGQ